MGWLAHPKGLGQPITEIEKMTISQMIFWKDRTIEINKALEE